MEEKEEKLVYTVEEIMKLLSVSRGTVYEGLRTGRIPSFRLGKRYIIPKLGVDTLLQNLPEGRQI